MIQPDPAREVEYFTLMRCMLLMSMLEGILETSGIAKAAAYLSRQSGCTVDQAERFIKAYIQPKEGETP